MSDKYDVIQVSSERIDESSYVIKYLAPSHTKDTVESRSINDKFVVKFKETEYFAEREFTYEIYGKISSVKGHFENGILTVTIKFERPRKLDISFE